MGSVDSRVPPTTDAYSLEVLTVATRITGQALRLPADMVCEIGGERGTAGHVLLTFKSGGMLLTSAGHWCELERMDVTQERLLKTAKEQYGAAYANNWASQIQSAPPAMQGAMCQSFAQQMVMQSAPCQQYKSAPPCLEAKVKAEA